MKEIEDIITKYGSSRIVEEMEQDVSGRQVMVQDSTFQLIGNKMSRPEFSCWIEDTRTGEKLTYVVTIIAKMDGMPPQIKADSLDSIGGRNTHTTGLSFIVEDKDSGINDIELTSVSLGARSQVEIIGTNLGNGQTKYTLISRDIYHITERFVRYYFIIRDNVGNELSADLVTPLGTQPNEDKICKLGDLIYHHYTYTSPDDFQKDWYHQTSDEPAIWCGLLDTTSSSTRWRWTRYGVSEDGYPTANYTRSEYSDHKLPTGNHSHFGTKKTFNYRGTIFLVRAAGWTDYKDYTLLPTFDRMTRTPYVKDPSLETWENGVTALLNDYFGV